MSPILSILSIVIISNVVISNLIVGFVVVSMEQHTLKTINNCLNTNLETFGCQSSYIYLNVVLFLKISVN
jgi:hypothetical protein